MKDVRGQVAVITGAGSGMGRATVLSLARRGARCVVADLRQDRIDEVLQAVQAEGGTAAGMVADLTTDDGLERVYRLSIDRFGQVDILMNNIAVVPSGRFEDISLDVWRQTFEINVLSYVRATQKMLPAMIERGSGHIVNTASAAATHPYNHDRLAYNATKAAVISFSEGLALYARPHGVGVTCLVPGPVRTNMIEQMHFYSGAPKVGVPALSMVEPAAVGEMVVGALLENRFFLPTNPELTTICIERAQDVDAFLARAALRLNAPLS